MSTPDIRDSNQVQQAVADVRQEFGDIDGLVNNAGTLTVGPMDTMTGRAGLRAGSEYLLSGPIPSHAGCAALNVDGGKQDGS